ncbi:uncharacterized protein UTRI_06251 [Ustilago trichophora]|uniref:Uncharacterized protein n=1 Tax=Ustilago trichophora TaxID=86804 RepID=A0A5C3EFU6_9BASI|nr:uncharacterized protein UTRI_06251 [Ustilago trichophora]
MRTFAILTWLVSALACSSLVAANDDYLTKPFVVVPSHDEAMQNFFGETLQERLRRPWNPPTDLQNAYVWPIPRSEHPLSDREAVGALRDSANERLVVLGNALPLHPDVHGFSVALPLGDRGAVGTPNYKTVGFLSAVPEYDGNGEMKNVRIHVNGFGRVYNARDFEDALANAAAPEAGAVIESGDILTTRQLFKSLSRLFRAV